MQIGDGAAAVSTYHPGAMNETVEKQLADLQQEVAELKARILGLTPREKDWRKTVGLFPRDELTLSAERHGREYREQQREP